MVFELLAWLSPGSSTLVGQCYGRRNSGADHEEDPSSRMSQKEILRNQQTFSESSRMDKVPALRRYRVVGGHLLAE